MTVRPHGEAGEDAAIPHLDGSGVDSTTHRYRIHSTFAYRFAIADMRCYQLYMPLRVHAPTRCHIGPDPAVGHLQCFQPKRARAGVMKHPAPQGRAEKGQIALADDREVVLRY